MSRRASLFNKEHPAKKSKVRFPDDLVFLDDVKDNDVEAMSSMLRRTSLDIDINAIMPSGMAPLHQAVLNGNTLAASLLISHGADVNKPDIDTWTPLHAACSEGHLDIVRLLLEQNADRSALTDEGERAIDLVDPNDFRLIAVMLGNQFFKKHTDTDHACADCDDCECECDNSDHSSDSNDVTNDDVINVNVANDDVINVDVANDDVINVNVPNDDVINVNVANDDVTNEKADENIASKDSRDETNEVTVGEEFYVGNNALDVTKDPDNDVKVDVATAAVDARHDVKSEKNEQTMSDVKINVIESKVELTT